MSSSHLFEIGERLEGEEKEAATADLGSAWVCYAVAKSPAAYTETAVIVKRRLVRCGWRIKVVERSAARVVWLRCRVAMVVDGIVEMRE